MNAYPPSFDFMDSFTFNLFGVILGEVSPIMASHVTFICL